MLAPWSGGATRAAGGAALVALAATAQVALAHDSEPLAPHDLWSAWTLEPAVLLGLGVAAWAYARGVRALWGRAGRGRGVRGRQVAAYAGGLVTLLVALVSPLDALSSALLSAHMTQHLLLILIAAPLLVLGAPPVTLLWALPEPSRRALAAWWRRTAAVRVGWHALTHPLLVWTLHAAVVWVWHLPRFYQAALRSGPVHVLEHASFLGTALLFWWVVVRCGERGGLGYGPGLLYVFGMAIQSGVLGALMALSEAPWYPAYVPTTGAWGLTPRDDQQLAGLLMWVPAGLVYLVAAALLFGRWVAAEERAASHRDREPAAGLAGAVPEARGADGR